MGLLDDAIREHLDLKRQHGASEDELARQEAEALGPVTEEDVPGAAGSLLDGHGADGESDTGWPFDGAAESELAYEPGGPAFEWSGRDSGEPEAPPVVPTEPAGDARTDEEPAIVDMPTAAFDVVEPPVGDEQDELAVPDSEISAGEDALDAGAGPAGPETELLPPPGAEIEDRIEAPLEPELEEEPLVPEPSAVEQSRVDVPERAPEAAELSELERVGPDTVEPDTVEGDPPEAGGLAAETVESLSEPEPLEPSPFGSPSPLEEALPAVGEPPPVEADAPVLEPLLGDETEERLGDGPEGIGSFGPPDDLEVPPTGSERPIGPDPAAEQGSPPASDPLEDDDGPLEDEHYPAELAAIDERPAFEALPDAEDAPADALDLPREVPFGPDSIDDDFDPPLASAEEPQPPAAPEAAGGFFEETEEHGTLWHEDRPGADPDFEN